MVPDFLLDVWREVSIVHVRVDGRDFLPDEHRALIFVGDEGGHISDDITEDAGANKHHHAAADDL